MLSCKDICFFYTACYIKKLKKLPERGIDMALFVTKCQHCQKDITLDDQWAGLQVNCPICNGVITVSKPAAAVGAAVGGVSTASPRMKLQIKKTDDGANQSAGANQFIFECPECNTRAVLPMNMFDQYYCCTHCKHTVKAGVYAAGRNNLRRYSQGAEGRVKASSWNELFKDIRVVTIILVILGVVGIPCFYWGKKYNDKLETDVEKFISSGSNSGKNANKAAGNFVPAEVGGRQGSNRANMLKERGEVLEKCQDDNVAWSEKQRLLKNLVENYPELKNDAEVRDWQNRCNEYLN